MTIDTTEKKDTTTVKTEVKTPTVVPEVATPSADTKAATPKERTAIPMRTRRERPSRDSRGRGRGRGDRPRSEFDQVTIEVRRVARVMAGGRRFSFSVTVVIGDRKGRVGVGLGKGSDTALAVEKAARDARRHLLTIPRTKSNSIPHAVTTKYASSVVMISPSAGRGIVAGSAMRTVLDIAGVSDVVAKILSRSKNKLTIARATVQALSLLSEKPMKDAVSTEADVTK